jgi:hypothetical protein
VGNIGNGSIINDSEKDTKVRRSTNIPKIKTPHQIQVDWGVFVQFFEASAIFRIGIGLSN